MPRQKKITKKATTKQVEKLAASELQTLSYQGNVCVKTMHGNKVINTKHFKNAGLPNLFKFISHALAGNFYPELRPCKVKLYRYTNADNGSNSPTNFKWDGVGGAWGTNQLKDVSPFVVYDATPVVKLETTQQNTQQYTTTFRFKIPYHWLFEQQYNVIGLFTEQDTPCAYYLFTDEDDNWATQELEDAVGNYSLVIEWTMAVSNQPKTSSQNQ